MKQSSSVIFKSPINLQIVTSADEDGQWVYGTYRCKATNEHGSAVMQYKLQAAGNTYFAQ
jgi:hypothetical protein